MIYFKRTGAAALVVLSLFAGTSCSADSASEQRKVVSVEETNPSSSTPSTAAASEVNSSVQIAAKPGKGDWPFFRGPNGMGVSEETGLPVEWSAETNIAWKKELPGAGSSSPVVFGDHIYLTSYSGYSVPGESGGSLDDLERHLICLQRKNGEILWKKTVPAKLPEEERIRDHGYAANTPVADADRVYAFMGKSGVFAYEHNGKQLWRADVGSKTSGWGTAASPVLYKDLVFINASVESESLIALDRETGDEKWRAGGIRESWNTPLIVKNPAGQDELVIAKHGKVLGFNPESGEELWSCDTDITWYMVPCPVAANGVVYYLGGRSGTAALAVKTGGRGDVTGTHRLWTSKNGSNVTSPVYLDGHLYWAHESLGIAYCAHVKTGELVYEKRLNRAGQIYASSILADGKIYYLNRSGRMFVVAAKPEFKLLATNEIRDGSQFNASPAVSNKQILVRSDKYLYCIGE